MNDLKYIIVIPPGFNKSGARAILFNGMITHSTVVPIDFELVSAGFCVLKFNKKKGKMQIECFGESTSLGVKSDPQHDQRIIAKTLSRTHPMFGFVKD